MATFSVPDIRIAGISASVPGKVLKNIEHPTIPREDIEKFIQTTGVQEKRAAAPAECTSDLCIAAAERLFANCGIDKSEIDIVVFVTQTADYRLPVTSTIIQDRMGLPKTAIAFDIPLGCSGYTYGLSVVAGMMKSCGLRKGLLLAGDTTSKIVSKTDKSADPLFGDAGSATILEYKPGCAPLLFDLGSDGSGYQTIIIPDGGARNGFKEDSLQVKGISEGISRTACDVILDGMDVFTFGISQAPKTVKELMTHFELTDEQVDYYIFHQANKMMNDRINKKLKLAQEKVPESLTHFGNTSAATVPLTIITGIDKEKAANSRLIMCGFGVGLSWGTVYAQLDNCVLSDLVETNTSE